MKKETQLNYDLYRAVADGDLEQVKALVLQGANINKRLNNGDCAIFRALKPGKDEILLYLIVHGADLTIQNKKGSTPLHYAVGAYFLETVKLLLEHGANIDTLDKYGNTPLWYACFGVGRHSETDLVDFFLKKGANPYIVNIYNKTPVSWVNIYPILKETFEKHGFRVQ